ncbi:MAG: DEAD/DEAH box helicase [Acidobacteria bacterium]|nr:DEAD/DEAH box helicase [Acidobacteriota bacterium]
MSFHQLGLSPELCRAITALGYSEPTPIQARAIPVVLQGRDLLAGAQTGTGKTAAFALPMLERLLLRGKRKPTAGKPRALVLAPTRELAVQVHDALRDYGRYAGLRSAAIFGGVGIQPQVDALRRGVDLVVATPGRLLDHMQRRTVDLTGVEILTLDEADRMLDMGFLPDLRRILGAVPRQRQTLLLSATLVTEVKKLAADFMRDPVEVQVAAHNSVAATVSHRVHQVAAERKRELLVHLLTDEGHQTLVFCRTKHGTDRLCRHLKAVGISAAAIHGDRSQSERTRALQNFKSGRTLVLVATDIAARGLDIEQLPMVINFDLPKVAGDYIHRIGRTGRAGAEGQAVSLVSGAEQGLLRDIQRLLACKIEIASVAGFEASEPLRASDIPVSPRRLPNRHFNPRRPSRSGARHAPSYPPVRTRAAAGRPGGNTRGEYQDGWLAQLV